jgi:hypothetical protein
MQHSNIFAKLKYLTFLSFISDKMSKYWEKTKGLIKYLIGGTIGGGLGEHLLSGKIATRLNVPDQKYWGLQYINDHGSFIYYEITRKMKITPELISSIRLADIDGQVRNLLFGTKLRFLGRYSYWEKASEYTLTRPEHLLYLGGGIVLSLLAVYGGQKLLEKLRKKPEANQKCRMWL